MEVTKILKIIILSAVIAAGISACASTCEDLLKKPVVLIQEPLVHPSKPIPIIQRRRYDLCVLHHEGIEIVQLGQTWKLVLPSDDVFVNETAELQDAAKPVLDVVADFLQTYSKISIQKGDYKWLKVPQVLQALQVLWKIQRFWPQLLIFLVV